MNNTSEPLTQLPDLPFDELFQLCMRIRMGEVKATPAVRDRAKSITFAFIYGGGRICDST